MASNQEANSRCRVDHATIPWVIARHCVTTDGSIRKRRVSCFPSWGFMFSLLGFHVSPRGVSCFPLSRRTSMTVCLQGRHSRHRTCQADALCVGLTQNIINGHSGSNLQHVPDRRGTACLIVASWCCYTAPCTGDQDG